VGGYKRERTSGPDLRCRWRAKIKTTSLNTLAFMDPLIEGEEREGWSNFISRHFLSGKFSDQRKCIHHQSTTGCFHHFTNLSLTGLGSGEK
jgi:hypothetical protein